MKRSTQVGARGSPTVLTDTAAEMLASCAATQTQAAGAESCTGTVASAEQTGSGEVATEMSVNEVCSETPPQCTQGSRVGKWRAEAPLEQTDV